MKCCVTLLFSWISLCSSRTNSFVTQNKAYRNWLHKLIIFLDAFLLTYCLYVLYYNFSIKKFIIIVSSCRYCNHMFYKCDSFVYSRFNVENIKSTTFLFMYFIHSILLKLSLYSSKALVILALISSVPHLLSNILN